MILIGVGVALLLVAGAAVLGYVWFRGKPASTGGDLERLAGTWECTFRDPAGNVYMHKVKQIAGHTETATWYRPDGSVFRVNRVEFELTVRNGAKVFRYFNGWVVDGPGAGQPFPAGEYEYELNGDTWTEFDPGGLIVWTRRR